MLAIRICNSYQLSHIPHNHLLKDHIIDHLLEDEASLITEGSLVRIGKIIVMSVSTRQLHREHLRNFKESSDDFKEDPQVSFQHETESRHMPLPPRPQNRRQSLNTPTQSYAVMDALSDENSKIARFLFVGRDDDDDDMPSMRDSDALWLALALEPMHIRNERILQLFEAVAIFGALFMNGVWILYEWGSSKGYGGDGSNEIIDRIFECVMAIALSGNLFLALNSAMAWIASILFNSSHQDWVFQSRKLMAYLYWLLFFVIQMVVIGIFLSIYSNLSQYWPETIVALAVALVIYLGGLLYSKKHMLDNIPLEYYHMPRWMKIAAPQLWTTPAQQELIRAKAKLRAEGLEKRAYQKRKRAKTLQQSTRRRNNDSIGALLREAAKNLDMADYDESVFEARLAEDWFIDVDRLKSRSVECLSQYMPLILAEEVHKLLEEKYSFFDAMIATEEGL